MSLAQTADAIGSITWTERTCGVLTRREQRALARPLVRGELAIVTGRIAMALRLHSGGRQAIDPVRLLPPDSAMAKDAETAARDLLSPALLNHSRRTYAWGSAIAALDGIEFDRELLYVAAMFHDTGLATHVPEVDFTIRRAALARTFTDDHGLAAPERETVANAIALPHTPGVGIDSGAEAFLLSAGAAVDVFGLRSDRVPDATRKQVVSDFPRTGFKREFARAWREEAKQVPHGRAWYLHRFAFSDITIRLAPFRG